MDGYRKYGFPRNAFVCVCMCVFLRGFLCSVFLCDCELLETGRVGMNRWNFVLGLSQQAVIGEPRVPPGRWIPRDHGVIHPTQIDMETALGCWAQRWRGKQDKIYERRKERKRGPGGPVTSEKCLWARFVKRCYFDGTMFTQRNTYWESDCAGRIWNCSFLN